MAIRGLASLLRISSRRYRQVLVGCLATLGVSGCLLATVVFVRWRAFSAVRSDTGMVLDQAAEQLLRLVQSRRGTLTLLRDILERAPELSQAERHAIARSAVQHTRHLIGVGATSSSTAMAWWVRPAPAGAEALGTWTQEALARSRLRNARRAPSAFSVPSKPDRRALIMLEPLRAEGGPQVLVGVFDLAPMLADFFTLTLRQPYPVQLVEGDEVLYRSGHWRLPVDDGQRLSVQQRPVRLNGLQWMVQMQPGPTSLARTISSFRMLVVTLSVLAGLATTGLIWLLIARAWFLQRAVDRRTEALKRTTERLRELATTDELTGLHNRRFFLERWQWEYDRARRYDRPLACLMIDVNQFKRINDAYGHYAGDRVLREIAEELRRSLRQSDVLARFGGDEFIVALPETTAAQAAQVAEKLRALTIRDAAAASRPDEGVRLSVGVGVLRGHEPPGDILQRADADLYASRHAVIKSLP